MFTRIVNLVQVVVLAAAFVCVVLLFANEPGGSSEGPSASAPGAAIYADNCASCHGGDGNGGVGPQLSDGAVVDAFPNEADQVRVVTNGRGGMPAFADRLSAEEIDQVVAYTRSL